VKQYTIVFAPEALAQLESLSDYIAQAASPEVALRYTDAIITYCETLHTMPLRGTRRDDIRPGLRITNYRKRAVIAFSVAKSVVSILGVYYGGQDYESMLQLDEDEFC
jgi:toxin ParE1/3/4